MRGSGRVVSFVVGLLLASPMLAQNIGSQETDVELTRVQVTATRDAFVKAAVAAGLKCDIAPPKIIVVDVPSFGNYRSGSNELLTPAWSQMSEAGKQFFVRLAGPGATEDAGRNEFETSAHHWIFVHEMGHWVEACKHASFEGNPYGLELGANRLAGAYWREKDPELLVHMRAIFGGVLQHAPNPVPAGQDVETYFNANYEKLGPSPAYPWFQSRMCVTALDERPAPTFAQAIAETKP